MKLVVALLASVVFVVLFRKPLGKHPGIFYAIAALLSIVFASHMSFGAAAPVARMVFPYLSQGTFAFGLLTIVMFVGVLPRDSKVRKELVPIRGELSIFASILMAGHAVNYAGSYVAQRLVAIGLLPANEIAGLLVALALALLLVVLAVTSIGFVRKAMSSVSWKKVQRLAYLFFALIYLHLVCLLAPSAFSRGGETLFDLGLYTSIMIAYAVLRVRRMVCDNRTALRSEENPASFLSDDELACSGV